MCLPQRSPLERSGGHGERLRGQRTRCKLGKKVILGGVMGSVPAAMIGLEDIPNEILIQVFNCLALERATLRCLDTTSKRISLLAIQILAHTIDVYVQTENNGKYSQSRTDHILRRGELCRRGWVCHRLGPIQIASLCSHPSLDTGISNPSLL